MPSLASRNEIIRQMPSLASRDEIIRQMLSFASRNEHGFFGSQKLSIHIERRTTCGSGGVLIPVAAITVHVDDVAPSILEFDLIDSERKVLSHSYVEVDSRRPFMAKKSSTSPIILRC